MRVCAGWGGPCDSGSELHVGTAGERNESPGAKSTYNNTYSCDKCQHINRMSSYTRPVSSESVLLLSSASLKGHTNHKTPSCLLNHNSEPLREVLRLAATMEVERWTDINLSPEERREITFTVTFHRQFLFHTSNSV